MGAAHLSAEAFRVNPTEEAIANILESAGDLAVLPHAVFQVMELTGDDMASAQRVEAAILTDPAFSAKVLSQVNSAFYALPQPVRSVREAIMFLGIRNVRQLALNAGVFDHFVGKKDHDSLRRRTWWRHSLDSAVSAKTLAAMHSEIDNDVAYTVGLLHGIGRSVMDRARPGDFNKVELLTQNGVSEIQAEHHLFGTDHSQVAVELCRRWGFPEVLVDAVDYLERPHPNHPSAGLRATCRLGSLIARYAVEGQADLIDGLRHDWCLPMLKIDGERLPQVVDECITAIAKAASLSL